MYNCIYLNAPVCFFVFVNYVKYFVFDAILTLKICSKVYFLTLEVSCNVRHKHLQLAAYKKLFALTLFRH